MKLLVTAVLLMLGASGFAQTPKSEDSEPPIPGVQIPSSDLKSDTSTGEPDEQPEIPKVELPGDGQAKKIGPSPPHTHEGVATGPIDEQESDLWLGLKQNRLGVLAGLLVAGICGYIGVYVVLKRIVFVGASLAQISSAGIALAFLLGQSLPFASKHPLAISLIVTLFGVLIYSQQSLSRRIPQESI